MDGEFQGVVTRILHMISSLGVGGAESMLVKLVCGMDRDRFENQIISLKGDGPLGKPLAAAGIPVHHGFGSLVHVPRRFQPDWIQGWMVHANLASLFSKAFVANAKVAWNCRHTLDDLSMEKARTRGLIRLSARLSNGADVIVHNSVAGAEDHEAIGYPREKRRVIPNGFQTETFQPNEQARRAFREKLGVPDDAILIGNVARFHAMKDQGQLLRALPGLPPNCWAVIVGRGVDESEELLELAAREGIRDRVRLVGQQSDASKVYPALDLFCLCSRAVEGFPNVVGEAMSCGVPCVVTDVGDAALVIGETGIVVPPRDTDALAAALREMIIKLGSEGSELREACRARIESEFSLAKVIAEYERLYLSHSPSGD